MKKAKKEKKLREKDDKDIKMQDEAPIQ